MVLLLEPVTPEEFSWSMLLKMMFSGDDRCTGHRTHGEIVESVGDTAGVRNTTPNCPAGYCSKFSRHQRDQRGNDHYKQLAGPEDQALFGGDTGGTSFHGQPTPVVQQRTRFSDTMQQYDFITI